MPTQAPAPAPAPETLVPAVAATSAIGTLAALIAETGEVCLHRRTDSLGLLFDLALHCQTAEQLAEYSQEDLAAVFSELGVTTVGKNKIKREIAALARATVVVTNPMMAEPEPEPEAKD